MQDIPTLIQRLVRNDPAVDSLDLSHHDLGYEMTFVKANAYKQTRAQPELLRSLSDALARNLIVYSVNISHNNIKDKGISKFVVFTFYLISHK